MGEKLAKIFKLFSRLVLGKKRVLERELSEIEEKIKDEKKRLNKIEQSLEKENVPQFREVWEKNKKKVLDKIKKLEEKRIEILEELKKQKKREKALERKKEELKVKELGKREKKPGKKEEVFKTIEKLKEKFSEKDVLQKVKQRRKRLTEIEGKIKEKKKKLEELQKIWPAEEFEEKAKERKELEKGIKELEEEKIKLHEELKKLESELAEEKEALEKKEKELKVKELEEKVTVKGKIRSGILSTLLSAAFVAAIVNISVVSIVSYFLLGYITAIYTPIFGAKANLWAVVTVGLIALFILIKALTSKSIKYSIYFAILSIVFTMAFNLALSMAPSVLPQLIGKENFNYLVCIGKNSLGLIFNPYALTECYQPTQQLKKETAGSYKPLSLSIVGSLLANKKSWLELKFHNPNDEPIKNVAISNLIIRPLKAKVREALDLKPIFTSCHEEPCELPPKSETSVVVIINDTNGQLCNYKSYELKVFFQYENEAHAEVSLGVTRDAYETNSLFRSRIGKLKTTDKEIAFSASLTPLYINLDKGNFDQFYLLLHIQNKKKYKITLKGSEMKIGEGISEIVNEAQCKEDIKEIIEGDVWFRGREISLGCNLPINKTIGLEGLKKNVKDFRISHFEITIPYIVERTQTKIMRPERFAC